MALRIERHTYIRGGQRPANRQPTAVQPPVPRRRPRLCTRKSRDGPMALRSRSCFVLNRFLGRLRSNAWLASDPSCARPRFSLHPPADQGVESVRGRRWLLAGRWLRARLFVVVRCSYGLIGLDRWSHWTGQGVEGGHGWTWMRGRGDGAMDEPAQVADLPRRRRTPGWLQWSGRKKKKKQAQAAGAGQRRDRAGKQAHPLSPGGRAESNCKRQGKQELRTEGWAAGWSVSGNGKSVGTESQTPQRCHCLTACP